MKMAKKLATGTGRAARRGFTLIEVLVTLAILAILVAVLFPIVLDQLDDADPTRAASDLASIRSGIELFQLNVRPTTPGDLEDLVHRISSVGSTEDVDVEGNVFTDADTLRWRGPYLDLATPEVNDGAKAAGDATATGFGGNIQLELETFDSGTQAVGADPSNTNPNWVIVTILDLNATQFAEIDELIDGGDGQTEGRFRFVDAAPDSTRYLAVPFRP